MWRRWELIKPGTIAIGSNPATTATATTTAAAATTGATSCTTSATRR